MGQVNFVMSVRRLSGEVEEAIEYTCVELRISERNTFLWSVSDVSYKIKKAGPSSGRVDICLRGYTCLRAISATEASQQAQSKGQTGAHQCGHFRCSQRA